MSSPTILLQQISIQLQKSWMNKNYATMSVGRAVETILQRGAEKLYDKYLEQKLPNHAHHLNDDQFQNNLKMLSLRPAHNQKMEVVATTIVQNIPIDNFAAKRIAIKKHSLPTSTIISKHSNMDKSTKYQTVIQSQRTINQNANNSKEIEDSMLLQEESFKKSPLFIRSQRPSTMQVGRSKAKEDNTFGESKIIEEEKRAATCHVRKRKSFMSVQAQKKRFIQLQQQIPLYFQDDIQTFNQIRKDKNERDQHQAFIDRQQAQEAARTRRKQIRKVEQFEALKKNLKGKGRFNPLITNFESANGEIVINGKHKIQQAHIIQLEFNPEEEHLLSTIQSKQSNVNPTKTKSFFSTKLKKKLKISNEEFTNNGSRQISSIPFVTLNYGIMISEDGLQATASRRRPQNELTRDKYAQEQPVKFKSHIPIVNSARINFFSTLDAEPTARSSIIEHPNSLEKNLETTIESKIDMQNSLLWNPRGKSQGKGIRVSNKQILQREVLQSKLTLAH